MTGNTVFLLVVQLLLYYNKMLSQCIIECGDDVFQSSQIYLLEHKMILALQQIFDNVLIIEYGTL